MKSKTTTQCNSIPLFIDGNILALKLKCTGLWVSIFRNIENNDVCTYADFNALTQNVYYKTPESNRLCRIEEINAIRLATEEEKEKLFKAIKNSGYMWNPKTKTLEELSIVPTTDKFDITTLKPFDKVLCRDKCNETWCANIYSHYDTKSDRPFVCTGWQELNDHITCIPYEGNEHLLGTTNDCDEYYKTW